MPARRTLPLLALLAVLLAAPSARAAAGGLTPGSPQWIQRDGQNMADAYGRQFAPDGQLRNPDYLETVFTTGALVGFRQLGEQVMRANRPALTPGNVFPGWNAGNPFRAGWDGRRGQRIDVTYTNRYGALIRGDVYAPLPGARDPYTHRKLKRPYPGVVITEGSVQGSEGMYRWLAEDLAERGYVVLLYDVQGQGRSETFPHTNGLDLPFCAPSSPAADEMTSCPGVPSQQEANFVKGTEDSISFFLSTPKKRYRNPHHGTATVNAYNPLWKLFDRRKFTRPRTKGRRTKLAIVGHSLGAFAVSYVQSVDKRVAAVIALDKLQGGTQAPDGISSAYPIPKPKVPALAVQSEYGFNVAPWFLQGGSSLSPQPIPPNQAPDPNREIDTGFKAWRAKHVDSMLIVPRASTHLEYTDIALALPASRYGQDLTSVYAQAWLAKYLKRDRRADRTLRARSWRYLEPQAGGKWNRVTLKRADRLSFYFCSAWAFRLARGKRTSARDLTHAGCR